MGVCLPESLSTRISPSGDELCTTGDTTAESLYDNIMSLATISFHSATNVKLTLKKKKKKNQPTAQQNHKKRTQHGLKIILYLKKEPKLKILPPQYL